MTLYDRALKLMFLLPPERIHGIISGALQTLHLATPVNRVMEKAARSPRRCALEPSAAASPTP